MTLARRLFGIDPRSLGLFRIGLALWLLADLALRVQDLGAFFTDGGVLPGEAILSHYPPAMTVWSLYLLAGSTVAQGALALVQAVCAGLLLIGFRTRLMTAVSWMFLVSLDTRNPLLIQGGDTMAQLMLFWGMLVPLGAAFSVDRARTPDPEIPREDGPLLSTGTIALLGQVFLLYYFAGLLKYQSPVWRDGTAVSKALSMPEWRHALGAYLVGFPGLLSVLTSAVLYFEIAGPFLLFSPIRHVPVRMFAILAFTGLQLGLGCCLKLGLFPFISTLTMVLFVPTPVWDRCAALGRMLTGAVGPFARALGAFRPGTAVFHPRAPESIAVAVFTLYVSIWNLCTLDRSFVEATSRWRIPLYGRQYRPPNPLLWLGFVLRINQAMTMFLLPDGTEQWHVVKVTYANRPAAEFRLDRASLVPEGFGAPSRFSLTRFRWGDFWGALPGQPWAHTHAGAHVCRTYRREHPEGPPPTGITIYAVARSAAGGPADARVRHHLLLSHLCAVEDGELEP